MMIIPYKGKYPTIGRNVFIAPTAVIIGDVVLEDEASVWFGAVVRGDRDRITVGARSNVQDNCTLHVDTDHPLLIGSEVTIGHNAVIHGCTIENRVLIGIGATILNDAVIHAGSVVAAGAVVAEGMKIGPLQLAAGVPAKIKKHYDSERPAHNAGEARIYIGLAQDYIESVKLLKC
ncbi:MAG: gamma carbonic anhydrase family protein [Desulfobacteraceae bacterium]|nr:MAG: gamma carbonic anhydrase family protein [Desulfobacteraceae bacterium]